MSAFVAIAENAAWSPGTPSQIVSRLEPRWVGASTTRCTNRVLIGNGTGIVKKIVEIGAIISAVGKVVSAAPLAIGGGINPAIVVNPNIRPLIVVLDSGSAHMGDSVKTYNYRAAIPAADIRLQQKSVATRAGVVYNGVGFINIVGSWFARLRLDEINVTVFPMSANGTFARRGVVHRILPNHIVRTTEVKPIAYVRDVVVFDQVVVTPN